MIENSVKRWVYNLLDESFMLQLVLLQSHSGQYSTTHTFFQFEGTTRQANEHLGSQELYELENFLL